MYFNLLEFRFFRDSERGVALPFGNHWLMSSLVMMPYVLIMELVLFRARRCFVRLKESVVGVVVLREKDDNLFIGSLGVAKEYRRLGIATYILEYAERLASALRKEGLELTVLRTNTPAQRLYLKLGFTCKRETRFSLILQKSVKVK